jgi:hypothetical protein
MSTDRDFDVDVIVARVLAKVRAAGLLPDRPAASEPERQPPKVKPAPRCFPQRNRYKKVLKGPRARQPLRSGQHPPDLRTLLASRNGEGAWEENTVPTGLESAGRTEAARSEGVPIWDTRRGDEEPKKVLHRELERHAPGAVTCNTPACPVEVAK